MKYTEGNQEISGETLYQEDACKDGIDLFVKRFGFYKPATVTAVVTWAKKHKGYITKIPQTAKVQDISIRLGRPAWKMSVQKKQILIANRRR